MFAGIRHFCHHLEGRQFTVWKDHKPLTFALSRISDSWTARQQRQLSYVAEYTSDIVHVPGKLNIVADLLSRPPQAVPAPGPATTAGVKAPFGSLAVSQVAGGTAGAPQHVTAAAVTPTESIDLEQLAVAQSNCPSVAQLRSGPVNSSRPAAPMVRHLIWLPAATGSSPLAEKSFPCCTLSCPSRHQSFQTTPIFKVCVERHGR